ncbi:hypothetical protein BCR44DRAFT_1485245 [Catenaria anguillulae PL171]|uniref:Tyrosinase copper-binding domain-containing protein n=1 Tax=Catenaria anguillulae PL171 TaxID=765915 RepID=A0A1Y2HM72_9FUNG|nr:hypothetical protein BCR44DRAFT_1485245 [Catenaria anguillulae PL171]
MRVFNTLFATAALVAIALLSSANTASAQCSSGRRTRKEISDLTQAEVTALITGMRRMYSSGAAARFVDRHIRMAEEAHNTPQFLPMHRAMLADFENELLQAAGGGLTGLPYWESTYSYQNPGAAFIFRSDVFGTANPSGDGCIQGPLADVRDPNGGCVRRNGQRNFRLHQPELMVAAMTGSSDYPSWARAMEYGQHASVHNYVSGNMGNVNFSPTDPIFFLHHCAVDYWWARWQGMNSNRNYNLYGGNHKGQRELTPNDDIAGRRASAVVDYFNTYCYEYQDPRNAVNGREPFPLGGSSATATSTSSASPTATPTPGAGANVTVPSGLTEEFIKQFRLDEAQATKARDMINFFVGRLNDQVSRGQKLPTLADLQALGGSKDAAATPTPTPAGSGALVEVSAEKAVKAAAMAVMGAVFGAAFA